MIQMIWEFTVREAERGRFELAYGPGGAWSQLFAQCPGFRGSTLLRDTRDPRRYLAVEFWDAASDREDALAEGEAEYAGLEAGLAAWTESRAELGSFRVLAEATVRPLSRAGHGRAGRGPRSRARLAR